MPSTGFDILGLLYEASNGFWSMIVPGFILCFGIAGEIVCSGSALEIFKELSSGSASESSLFSSSSLALDLSSLIISLSFEYWVGFFLLLVWLSLSKRSLSWGLGNGNISVSWLSYTCVLADISDLDTSETIWEPSVVRLLPILHKSSSFWDTLFKSWSIFMLVSDS